MKTALVPGSFDPPTIGHLDLIQRAARLCEKLIVGVAVKPQKQAQMLFTLKERMDLLKRITKGLPNVEIAQFHGLVVEFAKAKKVAFLIRGLRAFTDFEVEFQMALANRRLSGLETTFLMADERHTHISSSLIREIAYFGGPLKDFVPKEIENLIQKRVKEKAER